MTRIGRGILAAVLAAAAGGLLAPAPPAGAATAAEVRWQIAETVAAQIPGATVRRSDEEPLVGVPGVAELAAGRAEVMMDPAFWTQVVSNLLVSQTVVIPKPVDVVKPEAFLPTAPVENGKEASPLGRRPVDLAGVTYEWQGRTKTLKDFVTSTETDAVAFVHDGQIVTDLYANGWSADVRHQPWSVTKSFVSALVGIAVAEGRVRSIEQPIDAYVKPLGATAWKGTTIRNLLEMESGVHWDEGTPVLAVNTQVQQWVQAALDLVTDGALGQTRNEFLASLPREVPQGTRFSYNSGNTQLLAWLLETVYRKPFNEIVSAKLWKPAGMAGDARVMTDRVGDAIASQGLYSRIFDLARFGELFRHGGRTPGGRQVVPADWVRESTTMTAISKGDYAYQWWHGPTPSSYEASGFQGQKISVAPAECLTGVRLSHTLGGNLRPGGGDATDPASYGFAVEMGGAEWSAVYRAVAKRLGGCAARSPSRGAPARLRAALRLGGPSRMSRRAALRRGALRLRIRERSARTAMTLTARAGRTRIATRRLVLPAGRARTVSVPLTKAGRRLLRARRSVRIVVRAVAAGGGPRAATRRFTLRG
jgi:CubicO group peptidase (beta-lactamase class C family)